VHGFVDPARLAVLARGTTVDGVAYGPIRAQLERQQGSNAWITLSLQEGKNREVRRVLEHLGYPVTRLIRLAYGPFQLGHLARGAIEEVLKKVLEEQLGKSSHGDAQSGNHGTAKRAPRRSPRPRGNPPPQAGEGRMKATRAAGLSPRPSPRTRGEGVAAKPRRARGSMGGP
jgi:23S rRNA pseudouridine2605 synthase